MSTLVRNRTREEVFADEAGILKTDTPEVQVRKHFAAAGYEYHEAAKRCGKLLAHCSCQEGRIQAIQRVLEGGKL